jgi:DNA-binding MarR family transcriptional regulator
MLSIEETAALASQMRISVGRLRRRLVAERDHEAVPITAMAVLCALDRYGAMSAGELAAHEQVRSPSMTRTLRILEQQDCVSLAAHPNDGRVRVVELTDHGRQLVLADRQARDAWLACQLDGLPPEQREVLARAVPILEMLSRRR